MQARDFVVVAKEVRMFGAVADGVLQLELGELRSRLVIHMREVLGHVLRSYSVSVLRGAMRRECKFTFVPESMQPLPASWAAAAEPSGVQF